MATKIFGWGLLIIGVITIGWTLYSSYNIFTGKTEALEIFKIEKEITEAPVAVQRKLPTVPAEIQEELKKIVGEQLKGMLPIDAIPKMLNLIVWSMLAFILIFGGAQISNLGIKLIKRS